MVTLRRLTACFSRTFHVSVSWPGLLMRRKVLYSEGHGAGSSTVRRASRSSRKVGDLGAALVW